MGTQGEHEEGNDQREVIGLNFYSRVLTALPMHHEVGVQARMPVSTEKVWEVADMLWVLGDCILAAEVSSPCHVDPDGSSVLRWRSRHFCPKSTAGGVRKISGLDVRKGGVEVELADLSSSHGGSVLYAMWGEGPCDQVCLGGGNTRSHGA